MDKYSVELDEEKTKQSSSRQVCESCGKDFGIIMLPQDGHCPHCGSTKNFEKRPEKK